LRTNPVMTSAKKKNPAKLDINISSSITMIHCNTNQLFH
jgi:hypothetical protein